MKKTILIEDQPIEINSSLGWLFCYREQFGHDILPDLLPLLDAALGALANMYEELCGEAEWQVTRSSNSLEMPIGATSITSFWTHLQALPTSI